MRLGIFIQAAVILAAVASSAVTAEKLRRRSRSVVERRDLGYPFAESCTALVGIGLDTTDPKEMNQTWMSCMTSEGLIHDIEAVCKEWVEEKVMKGKIKSNHSTVDIDGAIFDPLTDRVTLRTFPPMIVPGHFDPLHLQRRQKGTRTVLAVRVVTLDGVPVITENQIKHSLFGPTATSLANHMLACSQNNLILVPKNVSALIGGPTDPEVEKSNMTKAICLANGEGKEGAYVSGGSSGNFVECPAKSFACLGGGGGYGKEFAMPEELPQTVGATKILSCYAKADGNRKVDIRVTTHRAKTGFQFEIEGDRYFMSMVQLKAGGGGGESIFQYPFTVNGTSYMGAVPKTGIIFTPTNQRGIYRDISNVKMCVMPRSDTCAHLSASVESTANENVPYGLMGGAMTVSVPHYNHEGDSVIRNAVTKHLVNHFGVENPEDLADFAMYCLPEGVTQRNAYGFVYSWLSVYTDSYCGNLAAQMREISHNFGLGPSRSWGLDYGDYTGVMGDNTFQYGRKCYNAAKMFQTGWFEPNTIVLDKKAPANKINLHGYIKPLVPGQETAPKLIKLNRKSKVDLYIMCNWDNFDNGQTKGIFKDRVMISRTGFDGMMFDFSFLTANLGEDQTYFEEGYYDGQCDLTVAVGKIDVIAGICEVTITGCIDGAPTDPPTQAPTAPTPAPTPKPTYVPPPPCYVFGDLCATEADCCADGAGECIVVAQNDNLNTMIVCAPAGTDPGEGGGIGPPGPPGGTCDDNGECGPGENCFSCPRDCNAMLSGDPKDRFCCENKKTGSTSLPAPYSIRATDSRCTC